MLVCENLSCVRGERKIFSYLGFCLQEGSILLLKGANGSGKTSLIKIIAGLHSSETGKILWNGKPSKDNNEFKRELAYIGHKSGVKNDASVYENLEFWAKIYGTEILLPAALKYFDLGKFADLPAGQLSAGWQRRVALARLIIAPCRLWLLDEPTNFLDEEAVILTASLIESRVQQGGIVISASHIMSSSFPTHNLQMADFS